MLAKISGRTSYKSQAQQVHYFVRNNNYLLILTLAVILTLVFDSIPMQKGNVRMLKDIDMYGCALARVGFAFVCLYKNVPGSLHKYIRS